MQAFRSFLVWIVLAAAVIVPVAIAATSPLLQYRQPVYVAAGFAGIFGLAFLLFQPLLAAGLLPGVTAQRARTMHRWLGGALVLAVAAHIAGLWITSPPDMIDALTFTSPTLFTPFGVIAMWAMVAAALLAVMRRRLPLRWNVWRLAHTSLAALAVATTAAHAMLIEGTMGTVSKAVLCALVVAATGRALVALRVWRVK